jgi:methylthioribose-1-phosphate isomerase
VRIIDQRCLPGELVERDLTTIGEVIDAIASLAVRGAPAIGLCGAAGLALAMRDMAEAPRAAFLDALETRAARIAAARPTAVNLAWAVRRCTARARASSGEGNVLLETLRDEAVRIRDEDLAMGRAIGAHGLSLLPSPARVLTHCNTGALATAGAGTALAVVYAMQEAGRRIEVVATETRPLFQGARLTAWELQRAGIPVTVIPDGAAAAALRAQRIDAVLVGADRIASNGDVANKVGTYAIAIAAAHHGVPFHVFAPWSTVDPATPAGDAIPIESRSRAEMATAGGTRILPDDVPVWSPAFDVTPAALITSIVTDRGIHRPPYAFTP